MMQVGAFDILIEKEPLVSEDTLQHYGVGHLNGGKSGRYPWGSGDNPLQRIGAFSDRVKVLRKQGMTDDDIAKLLELPNQNALRILYRADNNRRKAEQMARVNKLTADGMGPTAIAREMGIPEGTVRSLMKEESQARTLAATNAANEIMKAVNEKGMIDIGGGIEEELNISKEKMTEAIAIMQLNGYQVIGASLPQATNPQQRTVLMAAIPPDRDPKEAQRELYEHPENLNHMRDYTFREDPDGSEHLDKKFEYPASMDLNRVYVRYDNEAGPDGHTGIERDGVIQLRRGVPDLDLQGSHYAQVRILVNGDRYLKGMAMYSDDIPDGYDVVFNTNKSASTPIYDPDPKAKQVLKAIGNDPDNPFGATIKEDGGQYHYTDPVTGERKLGLINKKSDEGDWGEWSHELPAQILAKQPKELVEKQLKLAANDKEAELADIMAIDNPTIKRHFLTEFANECDSDAVHLKAAALPRQKYQVILPAPGLKDNEVFAPNFEDGETVALIRFPHAGPFEIPILKVNNKAEGPNHDITKGAKDAVGINFHNAEKLSGADWDGDTVLVIPCNSNRTNTRIQNQDTLPGLKDFDPKMAYPAVPGMKVMKKGAMKQNEMGRVSNLIMDMYLQGAKEDEMARAVRHSMVVIDAEKHKLNYKQSEIDNDIKGLKQKYQAKVDKNGNVRYGGGVTLLTRAGARFDIPKRRGQGRIDPETGEVIYKLANETYRETKLVKDKDGNKVRDPNTGKPMRVPTGKIKLRMQKSTQMAERKDPYELSTGTPVEELYAGYATKMKNLAREARKAIFGEDGKRIKLEYNPSAAVAYKDEVRELEGALHNARLNAPKERKANAMATAKLKAMEVEHWDMTDEEKKKIATRELRKYRDIYGAQRAKITISDKQWKAIQSGAVHDNVLQEILRYADVDQLRSRATPRSRTGEISEAKQRRIANMKASNYTNAEIASALGISVSTVNKYGSN